MPSRFHLLAAAMILAASGALADDATPAQPGLADSATPAFPDPAEIPDVEAVFTVERFGEFRVGFFRDEVPNHVAAFLTLAGSGWYDGMSFHRVIPGYLIQSGDPTSRDMDLENDGPGGADFTLPAEPTERTHLRGTVAMAWRGEDPASAGSQFFIVLDDVPALDGKATPIGEVTAGMDTVDRISQVSTHRNRNPLDRVIIQSVTLTSPGGEAGAGTATSADAGTAEDTAATDPEGD